MSLPRTPPLASVMLRSLTLTCLLLIAGALRAELEPLPYSPSQPGYHDATLELAQFCLENKLFSEALTLCKGVPGDRAAQIAKACENQTDIYTADAWGGYLDRREAVGRRRAVGAHKAGLGADDVLQLDPGHEAANAVAGHAWVDGLGWMQKASADKYSPLVLKLADKPAKPEREATWDQPWVMVGEHFTLVTDLDWKRAVKYSGYLDRFHGVFFEVLGDVIPQRNQPNVVWCCKDAATFVSFSKSVGFEMAETNGGLHIGYLGAVLINAERCDFVGKKNKSWDNLARTMFHECAHRLVESCLRGRRGGWDSFGLSGATEHAWIVEGVAIVFEDLQLTAKGYKLSGLEDQRKYTIDKVWKAPEGKVPELKPIFAQGFSDFAGGSPISNPEKYALAGSVAWYCLFQQKDKYRGAFLTLLVDYYRLDTKGRDFEKRFGVGLADFQKEWAAWVIK
jgi:hypothetical protein